MSHSWTPLAPAPISGGAPVGTWVHVRVEVSACVIWVTAKRVDDPTEPPPNRGYIGLGCPAAGTVGVRTFGGVDRSPSPSYVESP